MKSPRRRLCHRKWILYRELKHCLRFNIADLVEILCPYHKTAFFLILFFIFFVTHKPCIYRTLPLVTERAFLDIVADGKPLGRIIFGLFGEIAPKAVENFVSLCKCNKGKAPLTGKDMCYKGSIIHRVIPNFYVQGGDYTHGDGTGGESIFEGNAFEDESFAVKHNRKYLLNMANDGRHRRNTNRSQWFINTCKTQWLDGLNEAFGFVLEGIDTIIEIEKLGTFGGTPTAKIEIKDSGTLPLEPEDAIPYLVSDRLREPKSIADE